MLLRVNVQSVPGYLTQPQGFCEAGLHVAFCETCSVFSGMNAPTNQKSAPPPPRRRRACEELGFPEESMGDGSEGPWGSRPRGLPQLRARPAPGRGEPCRPPASRPGRAPSTPQLRPGLRGAAEPLHGLPSRAGPLPAAPPSSRPRRGARAGGNTHPAPPPRPAARPRGRGRGGGSGARDPARRRQPPAGRLGEERDRPPGATRAAAEGGSPRAVRARPPSRRGDRAEHARRGAYPAPAAGGPLQRGSRRE